MTKPYFSDWLTRKTRIDPQNDSKLKLLPEALGFREGITSVHTSRTMMLDELSLLLATVSPNGKASSYVRAIVDENVLGKPTQTTRQRTAKRLEELYSLDPNCTLFRLLRHFTLVEQAGRPMLAFLAAAARDPLLRESTPFVVAIPIYAPVNATQVANHLKEKYPARFKPTTRLSTAQNLASSWTQAGYLTGKVNKKRSRPVVTPVVVTFALLLGYLCGLRGEMLLDTVWTRMLDRTPAVRERRPAVPRPVPIGPAVEHIGEPADLGLVCSVLVEVRSGRQHPGEKERRANCGQFALPDSSAGLDVKEVVKEAFVTGGSGSGPCGRSCRNRSCRRAIFAANIL